MILIFYLQEEEERKFDRIYDTYKDMITCTANSIIYDEELAKDAVQETAIKIIRSIKELNEDPKSGNLKAYIHRMTVYACYDILRREMKYSLKDVEYFKQLQSPDLTEEEVMYRWQVETVKSSFLELPTNIAKPLELRILDDMTPKEIAEKLDMRYYTVKKNIQRGRRKLEIMVVRKGFDARPD